MHDTYRITTSADQEKKVEKTSAFSKSPKETFLLEHSRRNVFMHRL
ncbi:hypothetical protein GbCGDNIH7_5067 [Granulibacter bethesdensis]|nr:hypothetical protein GbCGDNIH4_5067 [Granulibacter bethesdensis CGDNIH4]APH59893.1 hypothetical protein GbCGDNIH7_5067 [Granulibacter bethesdensis]